MGFKEELKAVGLTVAEFCRLTDTPRTTVDRWVYGNTRVPGVAIAWIELYKNTEKGNKMKFLVSARNWDDNSWSGNHETERSSDLEEAKNEAIDTFDLNTCLYLCVEAYDKSGTNSKYRVDVVDGKISGEWYEI
jgi:hypothetical protein